MKKSVDGVTVEFADNLKAFSQPVAYRCCAMGRTLRYFGEGRGVAPHGWVAPGDQMGCWGHRAAEKLQFTGGGVGVWVAWREIACSAYGYRDLPAGVAWRGVNCSFSARPAALGCATGGGLLWRGNRRTFGLGMADLRTWLSGVCHGDLGSSWAMANTRQGGKEWRGRKAPAPI
eukprot:COSAG02_NODE_71_length_42019_cov_36.443893_21_plen_174_part_00